MDSTHYELGFDVWNSGWITQNGVTRIFGNTLCIFSILYHNLCCENGSLTAANLLDAFDIHISVVVQLSVDNPCQIGVWLAMTLFFPLMTSVLAINRDNHWDEPCTHNFGACNIFTNVTLAVFILVKLAGNIKQIHIFLNQSDYGIFTEGIIIHHT